MKKKSPPASAPAVGPSFESLEAWLRGTVQPPPVALRKGPDHFGRFHRLQPFRPFVIHSIIAFGFGPGPSRGNCSADTKKNWQFPFGCPAYSYYRNLYLIYCFYLPKNPRNSSPHYINTYWSFNDFEFYMMVWHSHFP